MAYRDRQTQILVKIPVRVEIEREAVTKRFYALRQSRRTGVGQV
jgi:hypothetical protein